MRRRTWRMTKPTARPTAIPPTTETKNFQVAWLSENVPVTTATTANR